MKVQLKLNDKFSVKIDSNNIVQVKITKLGTDAEFLISGEGVKNPEQPREMSTIALVKWLSAMQAKRICTKDSGNHRPGN